MNLNRLIGAVITTVITDLGNGTDIPSIIIGTNHGVTLRIEAKACPNAYAESTLVITDTNVPNGSEGDETKIDPYSFCLGIVVGIVVAVLLIGSALV